MEICITILIAVVAHFAQLKNHSELMSYLKLNENMENCKKFIDTNLHDISEGKIEKLSEIRQELIHEGNLVLAEEVNSILSGKYKLSEYSFLLLNSYLKSEKLYKAAMNNKFLPSNRTVC
jgi:hypothetical protein